MSLTNQLKEFKAQFESKVDENIVSIIQEGIDALEKEFQDKEFLSIGDTAPNFTLPDANGKPVSLSERLQDGPVIITFYRGQWCPYCNLELRAYQKILLEVKKAGGAIIAISPQTPDSSLTTAEKKDLEFDVLSDVGSKVAESYGILFKLDKQLQSVYTNLGAPLPEYNGTDDWALPIPATFVIDRHQRIALAHIDINYQTRLEPEEALAIIQKLND
ncbi:MAG: peroxiredoxin-like family protein [Chlamydiota bacterium]